METLNMITDLTWEWAGGVFNVTHFFELFPAQRWIHSCNRQILVHTQRWEDSQLFSGYTAYYFAGKGNLRVADSPRNVEALDKVVRFENLQEGFDEVLEELGLPQVDLPFKNRGVYSGNTRKYRDVYTPHTIDLVRAHYKYEIETFGYEFGK